MLKIKNKKSITAVIVIIFSSLAVLFFVNLTSSSKGLTINGTLMLEKLQKDKIGVYIDGEVRNPGYIQIPKGSTLEYAISKAKGITKDADIQNINVKRVLKNQEKIIVPTINEDEIEENSSININIGDKININTANIEELTQLQGIGEKTAEKIIEYREGNNFDSIDEIMQVKGIGEGKFAKIKEEICV